MIEADLTPEEIRELRVSDNLTHDNNYDWNSLFAELNDMQLDFSDFDFGLDFGESSGDGNQSASEGDRNVGEATVSELPDMVDDAGYEDYQEPLSKEELAQYSDNADAFLMKRRVIITFKPEQEEEIKRMLGITEDKMRVVYDLDELIGADEE